MRFFRLRQISDIVCQIASEERLILFINEDSNTDVEGFIAFQAYVATAGMYGDGGWRGDRVKPLSMARE